MWNSLLLGSVVSENSQMSLAVTCTYLLYNSLFSLLWSLKTFQIPLWCLYFQIHIYLLQVKPERGKNTTIWTFNTMWLWRFVTAEWYHYDFSSDTAQCVRLKTSGMLQRLALPGRRKESYFLPLSSDIDHKKLRTNYISFHIETQEQNPTAHILI